MTWGWILMTFLPSVLPVQSSLDIERDKTTGRGQNSGVGFERSGTLVLSSNSEGKLDCRSYRFPRL